MRTLHERSVDRRQTLNPVSSKSIKHVFKKTLSISSAELLGSVHALEARKGMGIRSSWGRSVTRGPAVLTSVCASQF